MPAIKLVYFDVEGGRGGAIRAALMHAGVEFEDERISYEQYLKYVEDGAMMPVGLPQMSVDNGPFITQSLAQLRFAGKKSDLYPKDDAQALLVDEAMDVSQDMMTKAPQDKDPEVKIAKRKEFAQGRLKSYMDLLAKRAEATEGDFLTGPSITIADIVVYYILKMLRDGMFDGIEATYTDAWPALVKVEKAVPASPVMANYIAAWAARKK